MNPTDEPDRITGPTNELAKERNRAAAERTLTAWIHNCLTLIGFGFAIDRIFFALEQRFPGDNSLMTKELAFYISLSLIALSLLLLIAAMIQYYVHLSTIRQDDYFYRPSQRLNFFVSFTIIVFGLAGVFVVIFLK